MASKAKKQRRRRKMRKEIEIDFEDLLEHYSFMIRDDRTNRSKTIKVKDFVECLKEAEENGWPNRK